MADKNEKIYYNNKKSCQMLVVAVVIIFAVIFIIPVVMTVVKSAGHYKGLLFDCFIFYPMFWNSLFYAAVITLIHMAVIIPCAFGLCNGRFKGRKFIFFIYIVLMMMPFQVTMLPNYIGLRELGILNTRAGIILPMVFSPFGFVVMHQYMKKTDISIIEAMRLETNSVIIVLLKGVIPQVKTCIMAVFLFTFAECYNMLEQPMLFLKEDKLKTLSVFISQADKYEGNVLFPAAVIYMVPVFLLYLFLGKNLEEGLGEADL
ncbi:MAG: carbohydrate ABC transporter permease [Lachnospiraceae bacterium]